MNKLIEELKAEFSGSTDYMSGVNDGMYYVLNFLKNRTSKSVKSEMHGLIELLDSETYEDDDDDSISEMFHESGPIKTPVSIPPKNNVYSVPDCMFNYCPHPAICKLDHFGCILK